MSEVKFAIPKGSLEDATFKLLEKSWFRSKILDSLHHMGFSVTKLQVPVEPKNSSNLIKIDLSMKDHISYSCGFLRKQAYDDNDEITGERKYKIILEESAEEP